MKKLGGFVICLELNIEYFGVMGCGGHIKHYKKKECSIICVDLITIFED